MGEHGNDEGDQRVVAPAAAAAMREKVVDILVAELQCDPPKDDEALFALGADSISVGRIMNEFSAVFGIELDLEDVYSEPTLAGLVAAIARLMEEDAVLSPVGIASGGCCAPR